MKNRHLLPLLFIACLVALLLLAAELPLASFGSIFVALGILYVSVNAYYLHRTGNLHISKLLEYALIAVLVCVVIYSQLQQ